MQTLQMLAADMRTPSNIRSVARALFDPVQFDVFEDKWTRLVASAVQRNATRGPQDPRSAVGADMLLGTGSYADPQEQAGYGPLVLDQCQTLGLAALVQTLGMAAPLEPFATIVQGVDEPFMKFAGRLTASVERQLADPEARRLVLANLARSNRNADCKRVIRALPGAATVSQMAKACADLSPSVQKMAAWDTAAQPVWVVPQGWQQQWGNARASTKKGKRQVEREGEACPDTSSSPDPRAHRGLLSQLAASTCGSAGVDVCTAATVVLESCKIHKVPLDAFGPLGEGMSAFLMGRSSATLQGIIVHLGLIDADFTGQICAMVSTPTPPVTIPKGTRLAQLVPFKSSVHRTADRPRGASGFGSTGLPQVQWTAVLTKDRPEMSCTLSIPGVTPSEICLRGLLDSGADVTVSPLPPGLWTGP
ncbi:uncharacterized protein LOC128803701 [Vidua macroura]|uniref:uncharacterized protein LOC128803701 n=1 Tax=Vidua macroura TaxID=187451 RepID=UPI0023A7DDDE|nr:uncharacterized protein LOC128803701 [Vidua macroura]